jgi:hypothetical protein
MTLQVKISSSTIFVVKLCKFQVVALRERKKKIDVSKTPATQLWCNQRQSTLDCRYLTLLCDNLKMGMFYVPPWHYFGS